MMARVRIKYSKPQDVYWNKLTSKYRLMPKGRRVGFTQSAANYLVEDCVGKENRVLWVDTVYGNIDRYVERCFIPVLKQIPDHVWEWRAQKKELKINGSLIDFRSSDKAENIEGFGYNRMILNEAGIILKGDRGRYLWHNAILPMTIDYRDCVVFIGGTPKGRRDKAGRDSLYYELFKKAERWEPNFDYVRIPTNENPFLDQEAIEEVRKELPEGQIRDQEFYGEFVAGGSGVITTEYFVTDDIPLADARPCRSWDIAVTEKTSSDFSVGALCAIDDRDNFQVQDVKRVKMNWPTLKDLICNVSQSDGPDTPIVLEEAGQQAALIDDLQRDPRMATRQVKALRPEGDKLARAMPWVSRAERGLVTFLRRPWYDIFLEECAAFTVDDTHAHDDQIDAVSQAWAFLRQSRGINLRYV